jgi:gas vesicle protein
MDWGILITGIIGVISGNVTAFLFFPQARRMKQIENEAKQSEEWRKLYEEGKLEIKELNNKIDSLYDVIEQRRECEEKLRTEKEELGLEHMKLKMLKCEVPSCPKRVPPTGF